MLGREEAIEIAIAHVAARLRAQLTSPEGLSSVQIQAPDGTAPYTLQYEGDVMWLIPIPSAEHGVGAARYIGVSRKTGKILADYRLGE
jgi:hypothetical protein